MANVFFCELDEAVITAEGADAAAFLHAQLTSDVAALAAERTQWSGYCTPQGRLLATFLLWRGADRVDLQLPASLRERIRSRLARYVLRARVRLTDAAPTPVGVWGAGAADALHRLTGHVPATLHDIAATETARVARIPDDRFVVLPAEGHAASIVEALGRQGRAADAAEWSRLSIEAGIASILPATQELFVPQMVNLDLIGGVSFQKGCYPGQEIVARAHFLGRVKQRTHRLRISGDAAPAPGDALYSAALGAGQASGTVLNAAAVGAAGAVDAGGGRDYEALAVVHEAALDSVLHWRAPDGPRAEALPLPYPLPR